MRFYYVAALVLVLLISCDSLKKQPGSFAINFLWDETVKPDFTQGSWYAWATLEEWPQGDKTKKRTVGQSGPSLVDAAGHAALSFADLSYGTNRVVRIDIRKSDSAEDKTLFYGVSDLFEIAEGKHTEVTVSMKLSSTPGGLSGDFSITILQNGLPVTKVKQAAAAVEVAAEYADVAFIANRLDLLEALTLETAVIPEGAAKALFADGKALFLPWNLNYGRTDTADGERVVYVKLANNYGYYSDTRSAVVSLDTSLPNLINPVIDPANAKEGAVINLSFSFSEPVDPATIEISSGSLLFSPVALNGTQGVYRYLHEVTAADSDGTVAISVAASDLAGNAAAEMAVGTVLIDKLKPAISSFFFITPEEDSVQKTALKKGDFIQLSLAVSEPLALLPEVRAGEKAFSCTEESAQNYHCTLTVEETDTEGLKPVSVTLLDRAGNTAAETLSGDYRFDTTSPEVLDPVLFPAVANLRHNKVEARLSLNEPLAAFSLKAVKKSGDELAPAEIPFDCPETATTLIHCSAALEGSHEQAVYMLIVSGRDLAGNRLDAGGEGISLDSDLVIDRAAPQLQDEAVEICTISDCSILKQKAMEGDVIHITFSVSADVPAASVTVGDAAATACQGGLSGYCLTVGKTLSEGEKTVQIEAADPAGNRIAKTLSARPYVDLSKPKLISATVTPAYARKGDTVTAAFSFSEPVNGITLADNGLSFAPCSIENRQTVLCLRKLVGSETEKSYELAVSAVDDAGNGSGLLAIGSTTVDFTPPAVTVTDIQVLSEVTIEGLPALSHYKKELAVSFKATGAFTGEPLCKIGGVIAAPLACSGSTELSCTATYSVPDETVAEGTRLLSVSFMDEAGNEQLRELSLVQFDFSGPRLMHELLIRDPAFDLSRDSTNKIQHFSATDPFSGAAVTAQLSLIADELLDTLPGKVTVSGNLPGNPVISENQAKITYTIPQDTYSAPQPLSVTWNDKLGNTATVALVWKLAIDSKIPADTVLDFSKILYTRVPFGTASQEAHFSVTGETAAVKSSDIAELLVYSENGILIGRTDTIAASGSFSIPELFGEDLDTITLLPVKKSGARWMAPKIITRNRWLASFKNKIPGRTEENPLELYSTGYFLPVRNQPAGDLQEPTQQEYDNLADYQGGTVTVEGRADWENRSSAGGQTPETAGRPMVFDPVRGVTVLFGGSTGNETWEYDGSNWQKKNPQISPDARAYHSLVYHAARDRVILFGGANTKGTLLNDLWEWDGFEWHRIETTGVLPDARQQHAAAFDGARNEMVVFGGLKSNSALNDTWVWNGVSWIRKYPATVPSARFLHAMAYDPLRERTVVFGGQLPFTNQYCYDGSGSWQFCGGTWEWDGENWVQTTPSFGPVRRAGHTMAYDMKKQKVILFGGRSANSVNCENSGSAYCHALWEYDGTSWSGYTPPEKPAAQDLAAMTYDSRRNMTLLLTNNSFNDGSETWEFNGTVWNSRTFAAWNESYYFHQLCYHEQYNHTVLIGGLGAGYNDKTWVWNGNDWKQLTPAHQLPTRAYTAAAYDIKRGVIVVFGGVSEFSLSLDDTWEWNGTDWLQKTPAEKPEARSMHAMAYDPVLNMVVLYGGRSASNAVMNDMWGWNGTKWTQIKPENSPQPRSGHVLATDLSRNRLVLFGGWDGSRLIGDTMEWDGTNWLNVNPLNEPSVRGQSALTYDASRQKIILFGGSNGADETWEYDGTDWRQLITAQKPPAIDSAAITYDTLRHKVVFYSSGKTWELDGGTAMTSGAIFTVSLDNASIPVMPNYLGMLFSAGGNGILAQKPTAGVRLLSWSDGFWEERDSDIFPFEKVGELQYETNQDREILRMIHGTDRTLYFAVQPAAPMGTYANRNLLSLDYVELVLEYQLAQ